VRRDELIALLTIHDLHVAPIDDVGPAVRLQHDPAVAATKARLEAVLLARLDGASADEGASPAGGPYDSGYDGESDEGLPADGVWPDAEPEAVVETLRRVAAASSVPPVYDWVAESATPDELWWFLALEGGPDGGFDDLVALAQVGLAGEPKLEMARNYWDEMGRGDAGAVHTELHRALTDAGDMPRLTRHQLPVAALERQALGSTLATCRWLQPELVGALGLIELQAGPRCRRVAAGLRRVGAPDAALPFYDEHAVADPRHGKDWLEHVVAPLSDPAAPGASRWAGGMVRGARWRATANARFLADLTVRLGVPA
jgi:hypothetical protein